MSRYDSWATPKTLHGPVELLGAEPMSAQVKIGFVTLVVVLGGFATGLYLATHGKRRRS